MAVRRAVERKTGRAGSTVERGKGPQGDPLEREGDPHQNAVQNALTRRGVLIGAGVGTLGLAGVLRALEALTEAGEALAQVPGGELAPASRAVRRTITAYADTIVPGPAGGAHRAPGAVEAGAVEEAYDDFYGLAAAYPAVHADLQLATRRMVGPAASFDLDLPYRKRERVVLDRIEATGDGGQNPLFTAYAALAIVVWFAYYGTARSRKGMRYMGFPPHSDGYYPEHTYGIRFRGMTEDGNPR